MGVTEIARRVGLPKSVVHYHVSALVRNRYLEARPDRRYGLGYAALRLGRANFSNLELRARALAYLRALHHDTWETVALSALVGRQPVCIDQLVSPQEVKLIVPLSEPFPLHAGASGRAMLAFLPADTREAVLRHPLEPLTPRTVVQPAELRALLDTVRSEGVALSRGERQVGGAAIAAPVFDSQGVVGAMSICGPEQRFDDRTVERYLPPLKAAAAQLSRELGGK